MRNPLAFDPPVISVDVEDWPQSSWDRQLPITPRAAANTRALLELLDQCGVRATMFVLGKFAETFPTVVREIQKRGHEIACHGYGHIEIFKQSRQEFAEDLRCSKDILEQITGTAVKGYRAPDFSLVGETLWVFQLLNEMGFDYDSSVFPIVHSRYGIPSWPSTPVRVILPKGKTILELPIATFQWMNKNWPVGGGGYHRLLPGAVSRYFARSVMAAAPFIFYCHPYECDFMEFHEIPLRIPFQVRLHQGIGRRWVAPRLKDFLCEFGGRRMIDLINVSEWPTFSLDNLITGSSLIRRRLVN